MKKNQFGQTTHSAQGNIMKWIKRWIAVLMEKEQRAQKTNSAQWKTAKQAGRIVQYCSIKMPNRANNY